MIERIGELVAGILGLIKKGELRKASQKIDNAYQELLKKDAAFFTDIPFDVLIKELIENHQYTNGHLEILSELFFTQAELNHARGKYDESLIFYKKAHLLLNHTLATSKTFSYEKLSKSDHLQNRIAELENK